MRHLKTNIAIILGNGKSRQLVQLDSLKGKGTIFGCNALYRDWDGYDYLVAIDERMENEIKTTEKRLTGQAIFPPEKERWEETTGRRNNAGMVAMREAIRRDNNILYCLGFDFILSGDRSLDNVYKDSKNYEPHTQSNIDDNYHRIRYLDWFAAQNPSVQFVFVIPDDAQVKPIDAPNITGMHVSTFKSKLND
jgi:hypothetical protein